MKFDDFISFILVIFLLALFIFLFLRVSGRLRKGGGSLTTFMLGATDGFYNRDKKKAADEIVEQKADKKLNEQDSGEIEDSK